MRIVSCIQRVAQVTTLSVLVLIGFSAQVRADALPIEPGSWTLAVLPDTQHYTDWIGYYPNFTAQTQWIKDHAASHNIRMVLHEGDVVNNNNVAQWDLARGAMEILDGSVPYAISPGNHDYGPNGSTTTRDTLFHGSDYFGPTTPYANQETVGGFYPGEPGRTDNSYHTFSAGGEDWLVLALEYGPRDEIVTWANTVVDSHPNHKAMLVTHAYMYYDETRYDWEQQGSFQKWNPYSSGVASLPGGVNDGQDLWEKLVSQHEQFQYVFSGHVLGDGTGRLSEVGESGNIVEQMLANYQFLSGGGQGYMRLLEFKADGTTVEVRTYSPVLDEYDTEFDQQFTIDSTPLTGVAGDLDQDGVLEQVDDLNQFIDNWRITTTGLSLQEKYRMGDMNFDGQTNLLDAQLMEDAFTSAGLSFSMTRQSTPEPGSILLVALGVVSLCSLRRRRCGIRADAMEERFQITVGYKNNATSKQLT